MQEVPGHKSIGHTFTGKQRNTEIELAEKIMKLEEGIMKLAEGVTSKLCLKIYSLEKWINTFVQKIYEKGATPLVGPATATV